MNSISQVTINFRPESSPEEHFTSKSQKVCRVSNSIFKSLAIGIRDSKIFRTILVNVVNTSFLTLLSSPPGWLIAAIVVAGLAIPLIFNARGKNWQKLSFEGTAIARLIKHNYGKIFTHPDTGASIFLGAMPNRLRLDGEKLIQNENLGAVLSINESWERLPIGLSLPYTQVWKSLGISYEELEVEDHTLLKIRDLHTAADQIHQWVKSKKNVYVHCRAGVGRSAMAVFAYLVKYTGKSVDEAIEIILENRASSTIYKDKKRKRLDEFYKDCQKIQKKHTTSTNLRSKLFFWRDFKEVAF